MWGVLLFVLQAAARDPTSTVLNEWPMIMSHDAATTYLEKKNILNRWAKTQPDGGTATLLDCGARAFDWRPKLLKNGTLVMHHGGVQVNYEMRTALEEMIKWLSANGTQVEDLVVLGVTDCDGGDACMQAVETLLKQLGVEFVANCSTLKGMTVQQAAKLSALPSGGSLLATNSCWAMNYDPSVACSGFGAKGELYTCYNDSKTKQFPLDRMWKYLDSVSEIGPPADGQMYTHQAIWQETDESVIVGELYNSSLLADETRSSLNALVTGRILSGALNSSRINMVEVNNICNGGLQLLQVLRNLT